MKILLIGAGGTVGRHAKRVFEQTGHEVIGASRSAGSWSINIEDRGSIRTVFQKLGSFDALVNASGDVAFAPLEALGPEQWHFSLQSKLLGQINLVQEGIPFIKPGGSFTLITGILGEEQIPAGTAAATVNGAIEAFVKSAACELPKGIRINAVSPTLLQDSIGVYGDYFPGFTTVPGEAVAQAFKKSVLGNQTGQVFRVR